MTISLLDLNRQIEENRKGITDLREKIEEKTATIEKRYEEVVNRLNGMEDQPGVEELRSELEQMHSEELAELRKMRGELYRLMGVNIPKPNGKDDEPKAWALAAQIMLDKGPLTIAELEKEFEEAGYEHGGQDLKATIRTTVNAYVFFRRIGKKGTPQNPLKYDLIPEKLPGPGESAYDKSHARK